MNREMAEQQKIVGLLDALCDGNIELNTEFLARFASENVREQLLRIPEGDRAYHLHGNIDKVNCFFNGSPANIDDNDIWLDVSEIEEQFDGDAREYFDDIDEWTVKQNIEDDGDYTGGLAYLYIGYGLTVKVNLDSLTEDIDEALSN